MMMMSFDFSRGEKAEKLCLGFYFDTLNVFCDACARVVEHKKYATRAYFCSRACVCVCVCVRLRVRARARAIPHERGGV